MNNNNNKPGFDPSDPRNQIITCDRCRQLRPMRQFFKDKESYPYCALCFKQQHPKQWQQIQQAYKQKKKDPTATMQINLLPLRKSNPEDKKENDEDDDNVVMKDMPHQINSQSVQQTNSESDQERQQNIQQTEKSIQENIQKQIESQNQFDNGQKQTQLNNNQLQPQKQSLNNQLEIRDNNNDADTTGSALLQDEDHNHNHNNLNDHVEEQELFDEENGHNKNDVSKSDRDADSVTSEVSNKDLHILQAEFTHYYVTPQPYMKLVPCKLLDVMGPQRLVNITQYKTSMWVDESQLIIYDPKRTIKSIQTLFDKQKKKREEEEKQIMTNLTQTPTSTTTNSQQQRSVHFASDFGLGDVDLTNVQLPANLQPNANRNNRDNQSGDPNHNPPHRNNRNNNTGNSGNPGNDPPDGSDDSDDRNDRNRARRNRLGQLNENKQTDYTEKIFEEQMMTPFRIPYPESPKAFFNYVTAVYDFYARHAEVRNPRIFKAVHDAAGQVNRTMWNQYKADLYRQKVNANEIQDTEMSETTFQKDMNNRKEWFNWIIAHRLHVHATIAEFKKQLSYIVCFKDERPTDTLMRVRRYLNQISSVTKLINPHQERQIRELSDLDKMELLERIYITDNNKPEHGNNGRLNQKVVHKLAAKWGRVITNMTSLEIILKSIQLEILPELERDRKTDGKHWKQYRSNVTVFNLRPYTLKRMREEKSNNPSAAPDRKRRKIQPTTSQRTKLSNKRCQWKANCKKFINTKCEYRHTSAEIRIMLQKRKDRTSTTNATPTSKPKPSFITSKCAAQSKQHPIKTKPNCTRGNNCKYWQFGKCNYYHNNKYMRCKKCGKMGHPEFKCYANKAIKQEQTKVAKYNPTKQLNADKS